MSDTKEDIFMISGMKKNLKANKTDLDYFKSRSWLALVEMEGVLVSRGDHSAWCDPSSHSERSVESEVWHIGPTPTDRFSCGESDLHCI